MSSTKSMLLEADPSVLEKRLHFVKNDLEEDLNSFLNPTSPSDQIRSSAPFKMVKPFPGLCLKTFLIDSNEKFFINLCHTDEIPPPIDITEAELHKLIEDQRPSEFKVPLSMTKPRQTMDKSNKSVQVCDVAVNSHFFKQKILAGTFFQQFLISVTFELIEQKYNVKINVDNFVLLKNRHFIDQLIEHQIYSRDVDFVKERQNWIDQENDEILDKEDLDGGIKIGSGDGKRGKKLIQEITTSVTKTLEKTTNEAENYKANPIKKSIAVANSKQPEHRLTMDFDVEHKRILLAEFYLPEVFSLTEIILEVGEDRLMVEARKPGYLFDGFLPHNVLQNESNAEFDNENKILRITMPIV